MLQRIYSSSLEFYVYRRHGLDFYLSYYPLLYLRVILLLVEQHQVAAALQVVVRVLGEVRLEVDVVELEHFGHPTLLWFAGNVVDENLLLVELERGPLVAALEALLAR